MDSLGLGNCTETEKKSIFCACFDKKVVYLSLSVTVSLRASAKVDVLHLKVFNCN